MSVGPWKLFSSLSWAAKYFMDANGSSVQASQEFQRPFGKYCCQVYLGLVNKITFFFFRTRDYHCYCEDGFTGDHCQTDWDECWSGPCLNGASCIDQIADFNCTCPSGFSGKFFVHIECASTLVILFYTVNVQNLSTMVWYD